MIKFNLISDLQNSFGKLKDRQYQTYDETPLHNRPNAIERKTLQVSGRVRLSTTIKAYTAQQPIKGSGMTDIKQSKPDLEN